MTKYCIKCGSPLPEGEGLCGNCGATVNGSAVSAQNSSGNMGKRSEKINAKVVIAVASVCVFLLAGGFLLTWILGGSNQADATMQPTQSSGSARPSDAVQTMPVTQTDTTPITDLNEAFGIYTGSANTEIEVSEAFLEEYEQMMEQDDNSIESIALCAIDMHEDAISFTFTDSLGEEIFAEEFDGYVFNNAGITVSDADSSEGVRGSIEITCGLYYNAQGQKTMDGRLVVSSVFTDNEAKYVIVTIGFSAISFSEDSGQPTTAPPTTSPTATQTALDEYLIGEWELTADPYMGWSETWVFGADGLIYDTYGAPMFNWAATDDQTILLTYADGYEEYVTVTVYDFVMQFTDAYNAKYRFIRPGGMLLDNDMTSLFEGQWAYNNAYPGMGYGDLQASVAVLTMDVIINGEATELPAGFIRFSTADGNFSYCLYCYQNGILYINFDPEGSTEYLEEYVIVG